MEMRSTTAELILEYYSGRVIRARYKSPVTRKEKKKEKKGRVLVR